MPSLTEYERQVLVAIGNACKPNSPVNDRHWTTLPIRSDALDDALRSLRIHKMIKRKWANWYRVKPTDKGWRQIKSEKHSREYQRDMTTHGESKP